MYTEGIEFSAGHLFSKVHAKQVAYRKIFAFSFN